MATVYGNPTRGSLPPNTYYTQSGTTYIPAATVTGPANALLYDGQNTLSPRTQQYVLAKLLKRSRENIIIDKFAQTIPIPKNKGKRIIARRYENLAPATSPLTEGQAPDAQSITCTDVTAELRQYGGVMEITDQVTDFFDDPILNVMSELSGEQAADTAEALNWSIVNSGTNVIYCCGASPDAVNRANVNAKITNAELTVAERTLRRANARLMTSILSASPKIATEPIPASYVILCHTDAKATFEGLTGFVPVEKYASGSAICENEIGKVGAFRIILSNNFTMFKTAGKSGTTYWSGGNCAVPGEAAKCDVYSAVILSKDCFALTPLAGMEAAKMYVVNPTATVYDPLAQKGTVGWKMYHAGMILNDSWMMRIEFALN